MLITVLIMAIVGVAYFLMEEKKESNITNQQAS